MNALGLGQTYTVPARFDKAIKLIRGALFAMELSVVGEVDTSGTFARENGKKTEPAKILLVDCPLMVFEAQALDRAAGVFFPFHVLVWGDGDRTHVSTVSSGELFDFRLPVGAAGPMERLKARVTMALESVSWSKGGGHTD